MGPLPVRTTAGRNGESTGYPLKKNPALKNSPKQSVLSLVLIMSQEVFKFLSGLGRDCGFIQVVPVSRSP